MSETTITYRITDQKKRRKGEKYPSGKKTCIECKSTYHTNDAIMRGYKMVGLWGCVCDLCEE